MGSGLRKYADGKTVKMTQEHVFLFPREAFPDASFFRLIRMRMQLISDIYFADIFGTNLFEKLLNFAILTSNLGHCFKIVGDPIEIQ